MTPPAPTVWTYAGEAGLALLAGLIVAATQLSTALCGGDEELPVRARRQAWSKFVIALVAAPLFGGVMTEPAILFLHHAAPWPAAAVVVGISANTVWPMLTGMVRTAITAEFKARLQGALEVLANGRKSA